MPEPSLSPIDPEWALNTGLLHVINEAVLWPLGFALGVGRTSEGHIVLGLMESNSPIVPAIDPVQHEAMHHAFCSMLAQRFSPTEEAKATAEARARLVLPR